MRPSGDVAAPPKLLLDENVSPAIARRLNDLNIDAYHARDRGLSGAPDHVLWRRALAEGRTVVTINVRDFVRLAERSEPHPGIITFPSGCTRDEQFTLITGALAFVSRETSQGRSAADRWIEVRRDGSIRVHDPPKP